jgi:serine/threonine protein kinase
MSAKHPADLHGLDPRELLQRGMAEPEPGAGDWTPPGVAELATLFPGYEIEALLGRGGMGAVYRARQPSLDRLVAIKVLPLEISVDEEIAARFRREARALARLQHPHIIAVHESGTTSEGHLFFVMEYVEGADLAALLRGGRLDVAQALGVVRQVCEALQFAHANGVIHRDIKPANVLVNAAGCVKVGDFGLAKLTQADDSPEAARATAALGTPDYTAPEQWRGEADHRADIYSLGVMFYEMLTGEVPHGVFAPPSKKAPVDARLDPVVLRAMQEAPERRYQQAGELRDDVDRVGTPQRGKPAHVTIFAVVLFLGTSGVFVWQNKGSRGAASPAEKPAPPDSQLPTLSSPATWTNSLGMKFVPLGNNGVQICVWETRVRDFEEFVARTGHAAHVGLYTIEDGQWMNAPTRTWRNPGFAQTPDHPVCGIDWNTAQSFCAWLTEHERATGRLPNTDARYRLPTDSEWSQACGLPGIPLNPRQPLAGRYPWGMDFPPPARAGNYAGEEALDGPWPAERQLLRGYRDGFRYTAPVGSFPPNALGIYDLGGNLWEWCEDGPAGLPDQRWQRGASWLNGTREPLDSGFRWQSPRIRRMSVFGFRIVLAPK